MVAATTDSCKPLTYKQRLQYEIIGIDKDLEKLANQTNPQAKSIVNRIRDTLGRCTHIMDGVDTQEFCNNPNDDEHNSGGVAA
jgi:hypothetical protein